MQLQESYQAVIFSRDAEATETIRQSLFSFAMFEAQVEIGNIATAVQQADRLQAARIVIVDIRGEEDPFIAFTKLADLCAPSTSLIVIGDVNDIRFYRSLRRAGAAEYFFVPLMRELFVQAIKEALAGRSDLQAQRSGRLIFTVGVRGGCGATTLSVRTAALLSEEPPRPVLYLDLDMKGGDAALQLDLKPNKSLHEALNDVQSIDELFIERTALKASNNLSLMATLDDLSDGDRIDEEALVTLLNNLARKYRYVITEIPRWALPRLPRLAQLAGTFVLIGDGRMSSAREIARWREWLGGPSEERGLIHVLNMGDAPNAMPLDAYSLLAGHAPDIVIPFAREIAAGSVLGGGGAGQRRLDASLNPLVSKITGSALASRKPARSLLQRLITRP